MITLGSFIKSRRGDRSQTEVAASAKVSPSLLSFIEDGKKIRFATLRDICRSLKLTPQDWALAKLLWLEQQSGEPFRDLEVAVTKLDGMRHRRSNEFIKQVEVCLTKHATTIAERQLHSAIIAVLGDHRLLRALPDYLRVFNAIRDPEPQPRTAPTLKR